MFSVLALGLVERSLNAAISTDAVIQQQLSERLHDKCLRLVCTSPQLSVDMTFDQSTIRFEPTALGMAESPTHSVFEQRPYDQRSTVQHADCTLTVDNFVQLQSLFSGDIGNVPVTGDMRILQQLKHILEHADINLASIFQPLLGASLTGQLSSLLSATGKHAKSRASQAAFYSEEWLKEDNVVLAKRWEMQKTKADIRTLRTEIEREHARLDQLLAQLTDRQDRQEKRAQHSEQHIPHTSDNQ